MKRGRARQDQEQNGNNTKKQKGKGKKRAHESSNEKSSADEAQVVQAAAAAPARKKKQFATSQPSAPSDTSAPTTPSESRTRKPPTVSLEEQKQTQILISTIPLFCLQEYEPVQRSRSATTENTESSQEPRSDIPDEGSAIGRRGKERVNSTATPASPSQTPAKDFRSPTRRRLFRTRTAVSTPPSHAPTHAADEATSSTSTQRPMTDTLVPYPLTQDPADSMDMDTDSLAAARCVDFAIANGLPTVHYNGEMRIQLEPGVWATVDDLSHLTE